MADGINYMGENHMGTLKRKLIHKIICEAFAAIWKVYADKKNKACTAAELLTLCLEAGKIDHAAIKLTKQANYDNMPLLLHLNAANGTYVATIMDEPDIFWSDKQTITKNIIGK